MEECVKRLRKDLVNLWDQCHLTEEERHIFEYFRWSLYTENLLRRHDREIQIWKDYYATNSDLFNLLKKRDELCAKKLELEQRAKSPDKFKNRGAQLLKDERERNMVSKQMPKIEKQLLDLAEAYEARVGKPFLSWGRTVPSIIREPHEIHDENKRLKLSASKHQSGQVTLFQSLLDGTPSSSMLSCSTEPVPGPSGCSEDRSKSEYDDFQEGLCSKKNNRSTLIGVTSPLVVPLPATPNIVVTPSTSP